MPASFFALFSEPRIEKHCKSNLYWELYIIIMKRNVGILIFDDAEVLDFCGPFEVFAVTSEINDHSFFNVFTVSKHAGPVRAVNGLSVNPDFTIASAPRIDILIISGGDGSNQLVNDQETLDWVKIIFECSEITMSICSGARILGKIGLLDGLPYSTHHLVYDDLAKLVPSGKPDRSARYTDCGKILTSGGISAGIDLSFHVVERLHGTAIMQKTADYMEYDIKYSSGKRAEAKQ